QRNIFAEAAFDRSMILQSIQSLSNLAAAGVAHGADQTVASRRFILIGLQQIDARQSDVRSIGCQVIQRNMWIAPLAHGLLNSSAPNNWSIARRPQSGCAGRNRSAGNHAFQYATS